jgi:hypothetical protein
MLELCWVRAGILRTRALSRDWYWPDARRQRRRSPAAKRSRTLVGDPTAIVLPPVAGHFSYQIGGAYSPPTGTRIVDRDHTDAPDSGVYSICYVNAFQAQADAVSWWRSQHPNLLLRDSNGALIIDTEWDEPLLDLSTAALRDATLDVVGSWFDDCAAHGFRAVEADNLDSYIRSHGRVSAADALAFGRLLATRAHRDHLALGQKNAADLSADALAAGFDFAVAEECEVYRECDSYTAQYGRHVIEIEYTDQPVAAFTAACRARGSAISIVRRDREVTPLGDPAHTEQWCR